MILFNKIHEVFWPNFDDEYMNFILYSLFRLITVKAFIEQKSKFWPEFSARNIATAYFFAHFILTVNSTCYISYERRVKWPPNFPVTVNGKFFS